MPGLPAHLLGLVEALAEYQQAAADVAWSGDAGDGVRALAAHPLVRSLDVAERLYAEMAHAHRDHLPRAVWCRRSARPHGGEELRPPFRLLEALGELGGDLVVAAPDVTRRGLRLVAARELGDDRAPPGAGVEHLVGPVEVLERDQQQTKYSAAISCSCFLPVAAAIRSCSITQSSRCAWRAARSAC